MTFDPGESLGDRVAALEAALGDVLEALKAQQAINRTVARQFDLLVLASGAGFAGLGCIALWLGWR